MDNTVNIWTIQMGQWRLAKDAGIELLDITAKSGIPQFAPDYSNVILFKNNQLTKEEYTTRYETKMRWSFRGYPEVWAKLKEHKNVAVACYCKPGEFCHRHLFAKMMQAYLVKYRFKVNLKGELLPP